MIFLVDVVFEVEAFKIFEMGGQKFQFEIFLFER